MEAGKPGESWRNTTPDTWYQRLSTLRAPCWRCLRLHTTIWPHPMGTLHPRCECRDIPIAPGQTSPLPACDPPRVVARLTDADRMKLLGADVARLVRAGLVPAVETVRPDWSLVALALLDQPPQADRRAAPLRRSGLAGGEPLMEAPTVRTLNLLGWILLLCGHWVAGADEPREPSMVTITVRPTDLDSKGHTNNARYLEYLQAGRWRWLEDNGLTDESLRQAGAVLVTARIEIDYRAECGYGDTLSVATTAAAEGEKKVVFRQAVRRQDGTIAAEARVVMVAIDPAARKSRPLPDALRWAIDRGGAGR